MPPRSAKRKASDKKKKKTPNKNDHTAMPDSALKPQESVEPLIAEEAIQESSIIIMTDQGDGLTGAVSQTVNMEIENPNNIINHNIDNDASQLATVPEEEEDVSVEMNDIGASGDDDIGVVVQEGGVVKKQDEGHDNSCGFNKDAAANTLVSTPDLFTDASKQKDAQIFIGRLDAEIVEDDLVKVFGAFGEITSTRIIRKSNSKKSRGFAFIQYATNEQAKIALLKLKDGVEVRGKLVSVSACQDHRRTLYVGNICKTWTKDLVLTMLNNYGIDKIEELHVPDDSKKEGRIKGFSLLELSSHCDAVAALQRLGKPDAVFGRDISAKVAFAQVPLHPNEELCSQVKKVYIEGITGDWNEAKVKETCKQYGQIIEIQLYQNRGGKHKDFGYITFSSRESALACVAGINSAQIVEGEVKVKASIARSENKGGLQKQGFRGGFKVKSVNEVSPSKRGNEISKQSGSFPGKGLSQSKHPKIKGKAKVEEKGESLPDSRMIDGGKLDKARGRIAESTTKLKGTNKKRKTMSKKVEDHATGGGSIGHGDGKRPSKKPRDNKRGRFSNDNSWNLKRDPHIIRRPNYSARYALENNGTTTYYNDHGRSSNSASIHQSTDMAPHAGYIIPTVMKQSQPKMGYFAAAIEPHVGYQPAAVEPHVGYQPAARIRDQRYVEGQHVRYFEPVVGVEGQHVRYFEPVVGVEGQRVKYLDTSISVKGQTRGYVEPAVQTYVQPRSVYVQPAVADHGHDLYDPQLRRRVGEHDGQGKRHYDYAGDLTLPPSYTRSYSSYAGYEGSSATGYYQSGANYPPGRAYHQTKY